MEKVLQLTFNLVCAWLEMILQRKTESNIKLIDIGSWVVQWGMCEMGSSHLLSHVYLGLNYFFFKIIKLLFIKLKIVSLIVALNESAEKSRSRETWMPIPRMCLATEKN